MFTCKCFSPYFFLRKKVPKSSCNGFELAFGKFTRESKSIPKNIKLGTQLCFLNVIPLLSLGSADVATDVKGLVGVLFVSLWILAFLTKRSR
jgi:methyl coenzyme M reductase subunit D